MSHKFLEVISILLISCTFSTLSCKTTSTTRLEKIIDAQQKMKPADSLVQMGKMGIDLFSKGSEPVNWSLKLDFDKLVSFNWADGNSLQVLPAFRKKQLSAESEQYFTQTDRGLMIIIIYNSPCIALEEQFTKKVEVKLGDLTFSGCGKYLYDSHLNDIWVLETLNNIPQSSTMFPGGIPTIEFNLGNNKMSGTDGCNKIAADVEIRGNRIRFSGFYPNERICPQNRVQKIFSEMVSNHLVDYYIENGKLVFYLEDDSKVIFKRAAL